MMGMKFTKKQPHNIAVFLSASVLSLMLSSCGGGSGTSSSSTSSGPPPITSGITLAVQISGLPSGTAGDVIVSGPNGFQQTLQATTTLQNLTAGTYSVSAVIVAPTNATAYLPSVSGSPITLGSGGSDTGQVSVAYTSLATQWTVVGPTDIRLYSNQSYSGSGKMQAFAVDNQNPQTMYAGGGVGPGNSGPFTEAGIYKTTNGGTSWTAIDNGLTDPIVDTLWLDQADSSIVLAGTWSKGIFQSTNAGSSWTLVGAYGAVTGFLHEGSALYAATSQGVAESTDNGSNWTLIEPTSSPVRAITGENGVIYAGLDNGTVLVQTSPSGPWNNVTPSGIGNTTVWHIAVNPTNADNAIVVERYSTPELYETTNAGSSWTTMSGPNCPVQYIVFEPSNTSNLYAGCDGTPFQSTDGGASWSPINDSGFDIRLIVADEAGVPGNLLMGSDQGLFLRLAGSTTWQGLTSSINSSSILYGLAVNGSTLLTTVQDYSPINSFNGGASWQQLGGSSPDIGEAGSVLINPGNPKDVYAFTTGGFQISTDGGQTFTNDPSIDFSSGNFNQGNAQTMAVDPNNPSNVYVAAANGVFASTNYGATWTQESWPMPHPSMVAVDPANSNIIFVGNQSPVALYVTQNGGQTWSQATISGIVCCGAPDTLAVDPTDPSIVLMGMSCCQMGIWRSTDGGLSFTLDDNLPNISYGTEDPVSFIKFDPYDPGIVGVSTEVGLYLSSDAGVHWTRIQGNAVTDAFTDLVWTKNGLYVTTFGQGILEMPFP